MTDAILCPYYTACSSNNKSEIEPNNISLSVFYYNTWLDGPHNHENRN